MDSDRLFTLGPACTKSGANLLLRTTSPPVLFMFSFFPPPSSIFRYLRIPVLGSGFRLQSMPFCICTCICTCSRTLGCTLCTRCYTGGHRSSSSRDPSLTARW